MSEDLLRWAGTFRSNEGKKAKKFQRGLRQDIHDKVAIFDLCTYRAVLGKGQIVEGLSNNPTPSAGSSRASVPYKRPVPVHGQQDKRQKMVQNAFPRGPAAGQAQTCPHCGRNCGTRPCYCLNNACYKCLSSQHLIQDYPLIKGQTRPAASRRVFDITAQDAEATPDVIQRKYSISKHIAKVIIVAGSTRSFVTHTFAQCLNVNPVSLNCTLLLSSPVSGNLISDVVYKFCIVEVAGKELGVDLILLDIKDFDVILGMDWLIAHHAIIDCYHKKIVFNIPNKKPFSG